MGGLGQTTNHPCLQERVLMAGRCSEGDGKKVTSRGMK